MRPALDLSLHQQQKLIMTPELRQAIAVLQCPVAELDQLLQEQVLSNPALEQQDSEEPDGPAETPDDKPDDQLAEFLEYLGDSDPVPQAPRRNDEGSFSFETFVTEGETLQSHMLEQVQLSDFTPSERRVAEYLVYSLDDNGYLTIGTADVAAALAVTEDAVQRVLAALQGFDPPGVAARNLQECLLLQWLSRGGHDPLVPPIIAQHLDDMAAGRINRIATALGVSAAAAQAAADVIRSLDPKPGRRFGGDEARYVQPDAAVMRVGWDYVVVINDDALPRLVVSPLYRSELAKGAACDPEVRRFVEDRVKSAQWLIGSIEHRRRTIYRVVESLVRLQRPFFDRGLRLLRPLTLRQVADMVGVHESTVSRAVAGKYVQTPHGVLPLRFFFSSGVESDSGAGVSNESVKQLIRDLISTEDTKAPLSDQALAEALAQQGVQISRRTVAKYREESGVPTSAQRRRY